ncbi:MAG: N-acetylglucosaminyltransferase, partial [Mesorhizobium sp.]
DWMTGSFVDFRITPKGTSEVDPLPFRVLAPYAFVVLISVLPVVFVQDAHQTRGFFVFAIINACFYLLLIFIILLQ